jgi:DNA-binding LacI/PurR family transcriptional regulator
MAVTMRDVAAAAGVSMKTVSNVVNDYPHIRPDTRARVLQAIDELGYRPNLSARNLSRGRTGLIALALPELDAPYFSELARLIISAAEAQSWTVLIEQTDGVRSRELMAIQGVRTHLVDGVILSPLALGPHDFAEALGEEPVVLLGERISDVKFDHIAIDNVTAAREAVTHLTGTGRRRIAAIGAQDRESAQTAHFRLAGYRQALEAAGIPYAADLVRSADEWHRTAGAAVTRDLLAMDEPPDAIFCFNDLLALGALRALYEAGVRVPDDVAVIGFDDNEDGRFATPSLTTVAPNKAEIARRSVELLANRLRRYPPPPAPQEITASHQLVIRESSTGL